MLSNPELAEQTASLAHESILLVEDDPSSRHAMTALLSSVGYEIHAVGSGEEALRALATDETPTIAIVDLNLPGMNGLEFISQLKMIDPQVFVVLTTAHDSAGLQAEIGRLEVGYLRKPIQFDSLLRVLHA